MDVVTETQNLPPALLIVEDDETFAGVIGELARHSGFELLFAVRGDVGLAMAKELSPTAIVLDLRVPGLDGWSLLDRLKHDPRTAHLPVLVLSGDPRSRRARRIGAFRVLTMPVTADVLTEALVDLRTFAAAELRTLLVVEPEGERREALLGLLRGDDVAITVAGSLADARSALKASRFDAIVIAFHLSDGPALEILASTRAAAEARQMPVIVLTESPEQAAELGQAVRSPVVHAAASIEQAFESTVRLLHRAHARLSPSGRAIVRKLQYTASPLQGRSVLVVDDDGPSIFALRSLLESYGARVLAAPDGPECLRLLASDASIDAVLMDIMLPEMDGYEVIRRIRLMESHGAVPIVALTALAMKGDRERCLRAGASSYVAKPVDTDQLLALLRVALAADAVEGS
jgi:CheY-like chemotaxis protein